MIKQFLYKFKEDIKSIFKYPDTNLSVDFRVDYDKYWKKRRKSNVAALSSWQKQRADHILKIVAPGSVIMDVGGGDGALLKYMIEKGGIIGVVADMSQPMLDQAKALGLDTYLIDLRNNEDLEKLPVVDYVMGLEILEHMAEPETLIMSLKKRSRKGMIFSFPNTGYYGHRLRLLFGRFPLQWIIHPGEHLRYWTVKDVRWWVSSIGFKLEKLIVYEGLPFLNKVFPSLFGQGIIVYINER